MIGISSLGRLRTGGYGETLQKWIQAPRPTNTHIFMSLYECRNNNQGDREEEEKRPRYRQNRELQASSGTTTAT
jgi:hypothetical protein